jgi:uncharacterized protein YndB with AHSA1/START domain
MRNVFGAELRRVEDREHFGKPAIVAVSARTYDTSVDDLWTALTTPQRLNRWFGSVSGDLKLGGRYKIQGNAEGTISRCDPPEALDLTWEFAGGTSWVTVRLTPEGPKARLTLEHIAHRDGIGEDHLKKFGPAAVGIGWDLWFHGLAQHLRDASFAMDPATADTWLLSTEGRAFVRGSGDGWCAAHVASGADPEEARAQVERTITFYTAG